MWSCREGRWVAAGAHDQADDDARDHAISVGGKQNPCRVFPTGVSPVDDERRALAHGGSSRTVIIR
jgi:hypothetical protein